MRRLLILTLLLLPGPLQAQAGKDPQGPLRAQGTAAFLLKAGSVAGADRVFMGGWAGITLGTRYSLGGGGVALTRDVELGGSTSGTGFELGLGYGGILAHLQHSLGPRLQIRGGILAGAGHAEVRDQLMGREVGADNFGVMEPELGLSVSVLPWLHLEGSVGRRWVWGVEDLPLVQKEDLEGTLGTFTLRVGGG